MRRSTSPSKHRRVPPRGHSGRAKAAVAAGSAALLLSVLAVVDSQLLAAERHDATVGSGVSVSGVGAADPSDARALPNTAVPSGAGREQTGRVTAGKSAPAKPAGPPTASSKWNWQGFPTLQSLPASCWPPEPSTTTSVPSATSDPAPLPQQDTFATGTFATGTPVPPVPEPAKAVSATPTSAPVATTTVEPPPSVNC
jgi:hypothetical protein